MSALALFLAASTMALPTFSMNELGYLHSKGDGRLDRENLWSASSVELLIAPTGRIVDCTVKRFAGDEINVKATCKALIGYNFGIPKDPDGKPTFGLVSTHLSAFSDRLGPRMRELTKDYDALISQDIQNEGLKVPVSLMFEPQPQAEAANGLVSITIPANMGVFLYVLPDGKVGACEGDEPVSEPLEKVACDRANALSFAIKSHAGKPVPYVRYVKLFPGD